MRAEGTSYGAIANHLNEAGYATVKGCSWTAKQVLRIFERA